ncbi:MAG: FAD-binding protein [Nanoarchaeota archaeon]|nr:FAD-binding protein [Nanoarchaeota archaeon]
MKKVAIIGSGPAGLFSALELAKEKNLEVIILEKESYSSGGMINDCKLNLSTKIGMDINDLQISEKNAENLIDYIDLKFLEHGASKETYGLETENINRLCAKAKRCGLELIPSKQRHVGTDNSKKLVDSFKIELEEKGVKIKNMSEVQRIIQQENNKFALIIGNGQEKVLETDYLIVAPGRNGSNWFRHEADRLKINYLWGPIDTGIRIEMPNEYYEDLTKIIYDPKLIMDINDKEFTRTFCTNPGGRIRIEVHKNNQAFQLINGDANKNEKTKNTNLAILTRLYLTDPLVDTRKEGLDMAKKANEYGGGKPIIQKVGDFFENKRSRPESFNSNTKYSVEPTLNLSRLTPGDINLIYNYKIVNKIKVFLDRLDHLVPGVLNEENNIYAPELKLYDTNYLTNSNLETNIKNLFVAGDGAGKSRGIIGAALTGIIAARGVLQK